MYTRKHQLIKTWCGPPQRFLFYEELANKRYTHTHAHTPTHTNAHTNTQTNAHPYAPMLTLTLKLKKHTNTPTHTPTHTYTLTIANTSIENTRTQMYNETKWGKDQTRIDAFDRESSERDLFEQRREEKVFPADQKGAKLFFSQLQTKRSSKAEVE